MGKDHGAGRRSIGWRLWRHSAALGRSHAARARAAGLDTVRAAALAHLLSAGELTADEIGRRLLLSPAEALTLVEVLEQDGFLSRRVAPRDRRRDLLRATPQAVLALRSRAAEHGDAVIDRLDPGSRAAIGDFLDRVVTATEREADEPARRSPRSPEP